MGDLIRLAFERLFARPIAWSMFVAAICAVPALSLLLPPGILRVPVPEAAAMAVQMATWAGVCCGLWLVVEQVWALRLLARLPRFAIEWGLLVGCGALFAIAGSAVNLIARGEFPFAAVAWKVWSGSALALLLVQLRWRGQTAIFVFAALAWVLPAALPARAAEHRVLDSAYGIAQNLSPATGSSDKTTLAPRDLAPSAALLLMAWLLSRSGRR